MFGSEKAKNGYTLMVQMYFALQINQKRRTGMNSISEKELLALNDLLGEEELLIKKFKMLANHAEDEEIKDKFEQISERQPKRRQPIITTRMQMNVCMILCARQF